MRRSRRTALPTIAAALVALPALAGPTAPDPFARSVALLETIAEGCSPFYAVDRDKLRRYSTLFRQAGLRALGGPAFDTAVEAERSAQAENLARLGKRAWCLAGRDDLLAVGLDAVFVRETALG